MYNVKDFGAVGNNVHDDTQAIRDAVAYAKSQNGGQIFFPPGTYAISDTITIDSAVGVKGSGANAVLPTTMLAWYGVRVPMIDYVGKSENIVFEDICLDGRNNSSIGIKIDRLRFSYFRSLQVQRFVDFGIYLKPNPDINVENDNAMFNNFQSISLIGYEDSFSALRLDGTTLDKNNVAAGNGNSCHNTFMNCHFWVTKNWNVEFLDCDNNSFYMLYCFKTDKTTSQIYFGYNADTYNPSYNPRSGCARSNYIFHCQGSIYASAGPDKNAPECKNYVFGYDRENGQPLPITNNNAKIIIDGNDSTNCGLFGRLFR